MTTTLPMPPSARLIRVAHVPQDAPCVRRVAQHPTVQPVRVLHPSTAGLTSAWVDAHAPAIDVLHLHLGLVDCPVASTPGFLRALRRHGIPLVVTVHDVGVADDALVAAATVVLAVDLAAAIEARARWARHVLVTSHPHLAPPTRLFSGRHRRDRSRPPRVGLHLPSFAADRAALGALDALSTVLAGRDELRVEVRHHGGWAGDVAARLEDLCRDDRVAGELVLPMRADDPLVADWVGSLHLLVLASGVGSNCDWVELCRDLGTGAVVGVAPRHAVPAAVASYPVGRPQPSAPHLARAVERALGMSPVAPVPAAVRFVEAARVRDEHAALYRAVVASRPRPQEPAHGAPHW